MAQNDMNIANQGFPAFRADLNNALGALVSNNSGSTAPATTFAHQYWVDTSANPSILKIRNADNDAFITIGTINQTDDKFKLTPADGVSTDTISELTAAAGVTIDGVLLKDSGVVTGAGTVSAPVYSTTGDLNTGIFFPASDTIGLAVGGVEAARLVSGVLSVPANSTAASAVRLFEDTDNGTNFVALQAAAAIASDVTFTLPAADGTANQVLKTDGSGNLGFATPSAGKVLQVVSATHGTQVSSSTDSFVDTGLTASITPTSASSKILVLVNQAGCKKSPANSVNTLDIRLLRNSTNILTFAGALAETQSAIRNVVSAGACLLDSPATTSSVTYKTDFRSRNNTASVSVQYANISNSSIVLMEIAA